MFSHQQAMPDFGYQASIPSPEDSRLSGSSFDFSMSKSLFRDSDFSTEVADEDPEDLYRTMEQTLEEQRVFPRERAAEALHEPQFDGVWFNFLDEDQQNNSRRSKRAYDGAFHPDPLISHEMFHLQAKPSSRSSTKDPSAKMRRKPKTATKRTRSGVASSSNDSGVLGFGAQLRAEGGAPMTGATTRAEFERIVAPLGTSMLMSITKELYGIRFGIVRIYCSSSGRPPEHAKRDPSDGRWFTVKKVIPHQHKPEKVGDPSPRCLACAVRTVHLRSEALVKERTDAYTVHASSEDVAAARKFIIDALGLQPPLDTRVFLYDDTEEDPVKTSS